MPQLDSEFPLNEAREIVRDLARPRPLIYWLDFLGSAALGWGAFVFALSRPATSAMGIAAALVAGLALYRGVIFTHELAHLKGGTFGVFRAVWNLFCGAPMMVPSFIYRGVHDDHHRRPLYGTARDGEYRSFALGPRRRIVGYLAQIVVLPTLLAVRFVILAPLSWIHPPLARMVWRCCSSLSIDPSYRRSEPSRRDDASWRWQELGTCLLGWTALLLVAFGALPVRVLVLWYAIAVWMFLLNSLRTLGAHVYANRGDESLSFPEQFLDSIDVPGSPWITPLWAPVGLRFHATHHLFPRMPYHSLGRAHRRLVRELSDNTLYLRATRKSLLHALVSLWRAAGAAP